jgi:hypothetical protein
VGAAVQFTLEILVDGREGVSCTTFEILVDGREGVSCTTFEMKIYEYKIHSKTNIVNDHASHKVDESKVTLFLIGLL